MTAIANTLPKDIVGSLAKTTPKTCGVETKGTKIHVAIGLDILR